MDRFFIVKPEFELAYRNAEIRKLDRLIAMLGPIDDLNMVGLVERALLESKRDALAEYVATAILGG